jgi:hypothetical protein
MTALSARPAASASTNPVASPARSRSHRYPYAEFPGPPGNGIRDEPVDTCHCQQNRKDAKRR